MDKREVSTIHKTHKMVTIQRRLKGGREEIMKPEIVHDYNNYMSGVDKADQMVRYYSLKWWKRIFFHLLDTTIVNYTQKVVHVTISHTS